jgi:hypothetical protein
LVWPGTLYRESGPVIESPLLFASALQELVLQSWSGVIRPFPSMPTDWPDAVIANFRTEGAFLVGGRWRGRKTEFIQIHSLAGAPCVLQSDLASGFHVAGVPAERVTRRASGRLEIALQKGETVLLTASGFAEPAIISPLPAPPEEANLFGLNARFLERRPNFPDTDR